MRLKFVKQIRRVETANDRVCYPALNFSGKTTQRTSRRRALYADSDRVVQCSKTQLTTSAKFKVCACIYLIICCCQTLSYISFRLFIILYWDMNTRMHVIIVTGIATIVYSVHGI